MKQILSKSIVLIGMMGSGKSAVGEMLSERIGVPLSDTDKIIEEEVGKKIFQIFNDSGEKYFRQVEEKVMGKVLNDTEHIISTGGGSILSPKTRDLIKSIVLWASNTATPLYRDGPRNNSKFFWTVSEIGAVLGVIALLFISSSNCPLPPVSIIFLYWCAFSLTLPSR